MFISHQTNIKIRFFDVAAAFHVENINHSRCINTEEKIGMFTEDCDIIKLESSFRRKKRKKEALLF